MRKTILTLVCLVAVQIGAFTLCAADYPRLEVQLWTDTDDKDSEENVTVEIRQGETVIGKGGPWGGGEVWGDQEDRNNGQPHVFFINLKEAIPDTKLASTMIRVIKSQAGGNGG